MKALAFAILIAVGVIAVVVAIPRDRLASMQAHHEYAVVAPGWTPVGPSYLNWKGQHCQDYTAGGTGVLVACVGP